MSTEIIDVFFIFRIFEKIVIFFKILGKYELIIKIFLLRDNEEKEKCLIWWDGVFILVKYNYNFSFEVVKLDVKLFLDGKIF